MKTAGSLIERIRNHRARVHVVVANDGAKRAVCSCSKLRAPDRLGLNAATDDAFWHYASTGHRLATPRVRTDQN
jgi:hypothetical protein